RPLSSNAEGTYGSDGPPSPPSIAEEDLRLRRSSALRRRWLRKAATKPSTRRPSKEAPVIEYERQRMETMMQNSRVFRSLGIQEAKDILIKSRRALAPDATRPVTGDGEDDEQGLFDKEAMQDMEPECTRTPVSGTRTKRVMAHAQDQPTRITRQRTRGLLSAREDTTTDPQDGFTEDELVPANANTQANNQIELSTEGK
ncbi:unnamed protein product, partial [Urochloa humidicola]